MRELYDCYFRGQTETIAPVFVAAVQLLVAVISVFVVLAFAYIWKSWTLAISLVIGYPFAFVWG